MTSLDVLAWFTVLLCLVSVASFGLGIHNMLLEQPKGIETDGTTLLAQTLYTRDIVSDGTFDLGSATLPFDNVWTSNISNKQVSQLIQGSSDSVGDYLLCFNDDQLIQTTIHASALDGGPFMPLSGGTMEGDITTTQLVNVGTINSLTTSSWITNTEPFVSSTLAIYADGHIKPSTIESSSVMSASNATAGERAYFFSSNEIRGTGSISNIIQCMESGADDKLAIWDDSKWIMDSSINAADVLLESSASTNYVKFAVPVFTGEVVSNESITSTTPILYTLFAEPNEPLNLPGSMATLELTGMSEATPILNTDDYFTYASNTLTYTGPTFRARIQFSATLELSDDQEFVGLQLVKTGSSSQTALSSYDVFSGFENSQIFVYVTMVTNLVANDEIVLQGESSAVNPLVIFTQSLYTITPA